MGVPQPKPLHGFSPNFQGMLTPRGFRADYVLGLCSNNCCHDNTFKIFGSSLWVFHRLNPCTDFHQILRICLPYEDLELRRF